jgi:hypothetical protein
MNEVTMMRFHIGIVLLAVGSASGCTGNFLASIVTLPGSGVGKEESRAVDAFHAVDVGGVIQVKLSVTPGAKPSLKLSGDDNLVILVESSVRDGTLFLKLKDNINVSPKIPLVADMTTGELDRIEASGATNVKVTGSVKTDRFTAGASGASEISVEGLESSKAAASASGASHLELAGSAASFKLESSGASEVKAEALKVEDAAVSISGASGIALHASKSVTGDISGASRLQIYGHPERHTVSISGASSVNLK